MKRLLSIVIISIITIFVLASNVYAYENDIFKIDVPSDYAEMSYSGIYTFVKSEKNGIIIYSLEAEGLKKNISTMSQSEIEDLINKIVSDDVTIIEQKKEKLGKSKAIKAKVASDDSYIDIYIVVSDKHILMISFTAPTEAELDGEEYLQIKESFEMKEKTTNATLLKVGMGAVICVGVVLKFKRRFLP